MSLKKKDLKKVISVSHDTDTEIGPGAISALPFWKRSL